MNVTLNSEIWQNTISLVAAMNPLLMIMATCTYNRALFRNSQTLGQW